MKDEKFSDQSTPALLNGIKDNNAGEEYIYNATQAILKRWRRGVDLEPFINLLISENSRDRLRGAYYLSEMGQEVQGLNTAAKQLADDPISDCRRAFVTYISSSGYYDQTISYALAKCLLDLDLTVRMATIRWAVQTSKERFEDFSQLVETGVGEPKPKFSNPLSNDFWNHSSLTRTIRGLEIIRRIREGEEIQRIRKDIPEEDSFVFDSIQFSSERRKRLSKWRESQTSSSH